MGKSKANGRMTVADYAASRGASARTIHHHAARGLIELRVGTLDPKQADKAWGAVRRSPYLGRGADLASEASQAKLRRAEAKCSLERESFEALRERYVRRDDALRHYESEAAFIMAALDAMPQRFADEFAEQVGCDRATALAVLTEFAATCRVEIGDLDQRMANAVGRA